MSTTENLRDTAIVFDSLKAAAVTHGAVLDERFGDEASTAIIATLAVLARSLDGSVPDSALAYHFDRVARLLDPSPRS